MTKGEERRVFRVSRLCAFLGMGLTAGYFLLIALAMFGGEILSTKIPSLGGLTGFVVAAVILLFSIVAASIAYLILSNRQDEQQGLNIAGDLE